MSGIKCIALYQLVTNKQKMIKNKLKNNISLLLTFILISCSSPLEEIIINDFNLIRVSFNVVKEISSDGSITDLIEVIIQDKNYKRFKLNSGTITVNNIQMAYDGGLLKKKYYSDIKVFPDTEYKFVIALDNGETAISTLITPTVNYNSISYQREFSIDTDYLITWDKEENPVTIKFVLDDNSFGENPSYNFTKTKQVDNGQFIIDKNKTKEYPHANRCSFKLTYGGEKMISENFRTGVSIVEIIYNAQDVIVKK